MRKKIVFIIGILFVISLSSVAAYKKISYDRIKEAVNRDVIYEGIYIDKIHIGGLKKSEAIELLKKEEDEYKNKELKIVILSEVKYLLPYSFFEYEVDYENLVDEAYEIGKIGSIKDRYKVIKNLNEEPKYFSVNLSYNDSKVVEFINSIEKDYTIKVQNAGLVRIDEEFIIEDEIIGLNINKDESIQLIKDAILNKYDKVELNVVETMPEITRTTYEPVNDLLGTFYTQFSSNQEGRNENLRIASSLINGTILLPGEEFSTNKAIGPIDSLNGYKNAPIIVGGKLQPGVGGGVCQIATTLYNAVLFAELEVVQRQNHSLPVGYIEKGRDATLAGEYIDFKFINSLDTPIYIESYIKDYKIYMNIFGDDKRDLNRRIDFESIITETIMPPPEKITFDLTLKEGQEVIEKKETIGYTVKLYKLIYNGDELIDKKEISSSYYQPTAAEIRVGSIAEKEQDIEDLNNELESQGDTETETSNNDIEAEDDTEIETSNNNIEGEDDTEIETSNNDIEAQDDIDIETSNNDTEAQGDTETETSNNNSEAQDDNEGQNSDIIPENTEVEIKPEPITEEVP